MAIGPTRAEVLGDLLDVIKADYTKAVVKEKVPCLVCKGEGVRVRDRNKDDGPVSTWGDGETDREPDETDHVTTCEWCDGLGYNESDNYDFKAIPKGMRKYVTGFKSGPRGMLIPEMRNKDKALAELIKAIGAGWATDFKRDAYGKDAPADVDPLSKEGLIAAYQRIAESSDPTTAMGALREISKLKGYLTEDDDAIDSAPITMANIQGLFSAVLSRNGRNLPPDARAASAGSADLRTDGSAGDGATE